VIRKITSFEDATVAIKQLAARLDTLSSLNIDMRGRRVINASPSQDQDDYVIRRELKAFEQGIQAISRGQAVSSSVDFDDCVFGIAINSDLIEEEDITPHHIVAVNSRITEIFYQAEQPPVGSAAKVEVWKNLGAEDETEELIATITFNANDFAVKLLDEENETEIVARDLLKKDFLTCNVTQIGTAIPGASLVIKIRYKKI